MNAAHSTPVRRELATDGIALSERTPTPSGLSCSVLYILKHPRTHAVPPPPPSIPHIILPAPLQSANCTPHAARRFTQRPRCRARNLARASTTRCARALPRRGVAWRPQGTNPPRLRPQVRRRGSCALVHHRTPPAALVNAPVHARPAAQTRVARTVPCLRFSPPARCLRLPLRLPLPRTQSCPRIRGHRVRVAPDNDARAQRPRRNSNALSASSAASVYPSRPASESYRRRCMPACTPRVRTRCTHVARCLRSLEWYERAPRHSRLATSDARSTLAPDFALARGRRR